VILRRRVSDKEREVESAAPSRRRSVCVSVGTNAQR
jgi:hypothetical protein